jgi:Uncharacterized conserved protein (DUF2249)
MTNLQVTEQQEQAASDDRSADADSRVWRTPDAIHVDVRGLDPPQPMLTILRLLDRAKADDVVVARLDREPIFLYPELDDRGWRHELTWTRGEDAGAGGEVRLRLFR